MSREVCQANESIVWWTDQWKNNVKIIIADGAYDSDENFRFFVSK
jgi:hypothetical protein